MEAKTRSARQTQKLAKKFASKLTGGETIALYGDLGSGKTVFVQGLAKALGIKTRILSPTFIFVRSYPIFVDRKKLIFHHVDLYRVDSLHDYQRLGLDELFSKGSIVAIEWAEKIKDLLPKKRIDVKLEITDDDTRSIKISTPYSSSDREKRGNREVTKSKFSINSNNKAVNVLNAGGIVIFPTDTVYGIGCRFDNQKAIERLYQIKGTPQNQPLPILVSNISQVKQLAKVSKTAQKLIDKYWPGGLTIILNSTRHKPGLKSAKLGFRMPDSNLVKSLIDQVGVPIIGTSANFHGQKPVTRLKDLDPKLVRLADMAISGECQKGAESTVVDATTDPPIILRQGAVKFKTPNPVSPAFQLSFPRPPKAGPPLAEKRESRNWILDPFGNTQGKQVENDKIGLKMILKIDTTKREEVTVELIDPKSGRKTRLVEKQKLGSQALLPLIVRILKKNKADFSDLTALEVNPGPGSFTGTRVGVAVANALGFALNIPVNGKKGKIVIPVYEKSKFD